MKILRPEEVTAETLRSLSFEELSPEQLKEAYALAQAAFTAEDLQRYAELDEGVPADEVLREMDEAQRQSDAARGT